MNEGTCHCLGWQNYSQTTCFPLACISSANNSVIQPPIPFSFLHSPLPALPDLSPARRALHGTCAASSFTQFLIQVKGRGERRNDGPISYMPQLATDPQSLDSLWPSFSIGADQVLGRFSWAGSQDVPPLPGVAELVSSNAEWCGLTPWWIQAWAAADWQPNSEILGFPLICLRVAQLASVLCLQNYICEERPGLPEVCILHKMIIILSSASFPRDNFP